MDNDQQDNGKQVINPEVLEPEQSSQRQSGEGNPWRRARVTYVSGYGWPLASVDQNACLAPCVTLVLFLVCLFQCGFLAGLGFVFFHTLFGILGRVQATSRMMTGEPFNIWLWRLGNWICSFLLTVWLSGGFDK